MTILFHVVHTVWPVNVVLQCLNAFIHTLSLW